MSTSESIRSVKKNPTQGAARFGGTIINVVTAISNDGLPASLDELRRWSGGSELYRCPAPDGAEYVYIPGQSNDMPASNILVYEPNAVHDGHCSVLLLGGAIGLLTPEQLDQALAQTEAEVRSRRR